MAGLYIAIALLAVAFLNIKGSVFKMRSEIAESLEGSTRTQLQKSIVTGTAVSVDTAAVKEEVEEPEPEPQTMVMDEDSSITVQPGVLVDNAEEEPAEEKHYYEFTAIKKANFIS